MRTFIAISVCALAATAAQAQGQPDASRAEAEVRAVIGRYVDARDKEDAAAIGAVFTDDADQFNSSGDWRRGKEAVVKGTLQSSQRNPGARSIAVKAVRFPAPGVAIADGEYGIGEQRLWTTLVLTRQGETWKITAIRNMAPRK
jgi:uncharacterized protein (TIGR02246 family)